MEKGKDLSRKKSKKSTNQKEKQNNTENKKDNQGEGTINVNLPLPFIQHINNILLIANQRAHWQPNELIPVGTVLKELNNIISYYNSDSSTSTSEATSTS